MSTSIAGDQQEELEQNALRDDILAYYEAHRQKRIYEFIHGDPVDSRDHDNLKYWSMIALNEMTAHEEGLVGAVKQTHTISCNLIM